jgi:DNA-binding transcriptional regulator GbsR (MarR family)
MHNNLLKAQDLFIQNISEVCNLLEGDNEKGKIMAFLYISEKPVTKKEIGEKVKTEEEKLDKVISKALHKGIIREVKLKGKEELYYEINPHIADVVMENLKTLARKKIDMTLDTVSECQELVEKCEDELELSERVAAKLIYEKLEKVRRINEIGRRILKGIMLKDVLDIDKGQLKKMEIK